MRIPTFRLQARSRADPALTATALGLCDRLGGPPLNGGAERTQLVDTVCREVRTAMVAEGLHVEALRIVGSQTAELTPLTATALGILKNIARDAPNRKHLADAGAIPILVAAIAAPAVADTDSADVEGLSPRGAVAAAVAVAAIETLINVACILDVGLILFIFKRRFRPRFPAQHCRVTFPMISIPVPAEWCLRPLRCVPGFRVFRHFRAEAADPGTGNFSHRF